MGTASRPPAAGTIDGTDRAAEARDAEGEVHTRRRLQVVHGGPDETTGEGCPPPRLVFWETTDACNLVCKHCRREAAHTEAAANELSTAEGLSLLDQLAGIGTRLIVLSGGEPLLRDDLFKLIDGARARRLAVAVASNATLIDRPAAARLKDSGVHRVSVSLDGACGATHDSIRGIDGSFDAALAGAAELSRAGVPFQINATIMRRTMGELDELLQLAHQIGAEALHLFLLVPVGCGAELAREDSMDAAEYEDVLSWLWREQRGDHGFELRATCAPHYARVAEQACEAEKRAAAEAGAAAGEAGAAAGEPSGATSSAGGAGSDATGSSPAGEPGGAGTDATGAAEGAAFVGGAHGRQSFGGCLAGTGVCFVSHDGQVFPCGYLPVSAGNVREQPFAKIWCEGRVLAELRDRRLLKEACGICRFGDSCGGCRARAYGLTGDYLAAEPFCSYRGGQTVTP